MANLKINSELFLEVQELQRLKEFFDIESVDINGYSSIGGFRKNILENSVNFGLVKKGLGNVLDTETVPDTSKIVFNNGRVEVDSDINLGGTSFNTFKHKEIFAIDREGKFIYKPATSNIPVPGNGSWYWVRIRHEYSNQERGTYSISSSGAITGVGGELTKILRTNKKFPTKIRFLNASLNTLDYDVLSVIDDNNAQLQGVSFQAEEGLTLGVVGTFTYGKAIDPNSKLIFEYDSCLLELVQETILNTPPSSGFIKDKTFYLARVRSDGTTLVVQDKRLSYWETKGSQSSIDIERRLNPLIGVEAIKYSHPFTPGEKNIVEVAWGIRSSNWSIDTNLNKLTLLGPTVGGKYKTVEDFQDHALDGWRIYTSNGNYSRVISSIKSGSAINLTLDVLDIDNYYRNGEGSTGNRIEQEVLVVPNAENIELVFTSNPTDLVPIVNESFVFPINTHVGKCPVIAYNLDTPSLYNIKYRYITQKDYSDLVVIPSDSQIDKADAGYYNESSFDVNGNLLLSGTTKVKYTSLDEEGFIQVNLSNEAYTRFVRKVDKGDLIGVEKLTTLEDLNVIDLVVGVSKNYQLVTGIPSLTDDVIFSLKNTEAVEGNSFTIHLNCTNIELNGYRILIVQDLVGVTYPMKTILQGDVYSMLNQNGGITFTCVYQGTSWVLYQNYDAESQPEFKMVDGDLSLKFDNLGLGKIPGYYGYGLCGVAAGTPSLGGRFPVFYDSSDSDYNATGKTGGLKNVQLTGDQNGPHTHSVQGGSSDAGDALPTLGTVAGNSFQTASSGLGEAHENRPPYYVLGLAKRMY